MAVAFFALAAAGRVDFAIVSESRSTGVSERKPVDGSKREKAGGDRS